MKNKIVIGTRGSKLALFQTELVKRKLLEIFPDLSVEIKIIKTEGDWDSVSPLSSFEGRGAFVTTIETALMKNEIDASVHSLKDLPSGLPEGIVLCAVPDREDVRDSLITKMGEHLGELPSGSIIGTGSERRAVQLKRIRPDLKFKNIRGNIETRIDKLKSGDYDAVVIAAAAIKRLGFTSIVTEYISDEKYISAPCQGAIGIECRKNDMEVISIMSRIDNPQVRICVETERAFINTLGYGCHTPVGAFARIDEENIIFQTFVAYGEDKFVEETVHAPKSSILGAVRELAVKIKVKINNEISGK